MATEIPEAALTPDQKWQAERMAKYFNFAHLPAHLAEVSKPFHNLAYYIVTSVPSNAERTVALRKLLEAKDCAVRAVLP